MSDKDLTKTEETTVEETVEETAENKKEIKKAKKQEKKAAKKEKKLAKKELKKESKSNKGLIIVVIILLVLNLAGVSVAVVMSLKAMNNSKDAKDSSNETKELLVSTLGAYDQYGETHEDDIKIAGEYMIKSTKHISDAYISGDVSELSEEDVETLQMASKILDEIITDGMTEYEKEKAVYDWMTSNLAHDDGMMQVIPTKGSMVDNPYGVLKGRKAVCVGFATTFRLFMQMLDIECMVIHNNECYHSWDLVCLDDEWYHVDIYSDVGIGNYASFNVTDMVKGYDWDIEFFPAANGLKYNYYYSNMITVNNVYEIPQALRTAMNNHEGGVYIKVKEAPSETDMYAASQMTTVIDQNLMNMYNVDEDIDFPYCLNSYDWIQGIDENENIYAVTFGAYREDDVSEPVDIGEIDENQANDALQGAFGDVFENIDINNNYWDDDYWGNDWDDCWTDDCVDEWN